MTEKRELNVQADGLFFGKVRIGDVYQEVDGYFVFVPGGRGGCWASYELKMVAEFLDELNEPWDTEVREYFANQTD